MIAATNRTTATPTSLLQFPSADPSRVAGQTKPPRPAHQPNLGASSGVAVGGSRGTLARQRIQVTGPAGGVGGPACRAILKVADTPPTKRSLNKKRDRPTKAARPRSRQTPPAPQLHAPTTTPRIPSTPEKPLKLPPTSLDYHYNVTNPAPTSRIRELDALRGVGALLVVIYHFTTIFENEYGHPQPFPFHLNIGYYGVHLFFIVSGFVIYMTLERTRSAKDFLISRLTRLYPAYWASLLITLLVVSLLGLPGQERTLWEAIANLTMLHEYVGIRHIDGVYWTLTIELAFYAWMSAFHRTGLLQYPLRMLIIWLTANSIAFAVAIALGVDLPAPLGYALLTGHGNLFFAGIGFYLWRQHHSPAAIILIALTLILEAALRPDVILVNLALYTLFALATTNRLPLLATRPLLYLGAISYPLYLIHQYIGYVIIRQLYAANLGHPAIILGVPIVIALLLAALIHHTIEAPALRILRRRLIPRPQPTPIDEPTAPATPIPLARAG